MSRRGRGEGTIGKRADGRWCARISIPTATGGRRRVSVYGRTRAEVARKLADAQRQVASGIPLADQRTTVGAYLSWWADEVLPGTVKPSTLASYRWLLAHYVIPHIGHRRLARLSPQNVQWMMNELHARGLSASSQRLARAVLRRALSHAVKWEMVSRNAAALVDVPRRHGSRLDDVLTMDEARAVMSTSAGTLLGDVIAVAIGTGLRKGELLALRWEHLDLDAMTLTVVGSLSRRPGVGLVEDTPKTSRSRRTIPMPGFVVQALRSQKVRQAAERLAAGPMWCHDGHVFTTPRGTPLDPSNVLRAFQAACVSAGIGSRRFHALRHSAATLMLASGVPLEVVSRTLGHAGLAITADLYARVLPAAQQEAAQRLHAVLGGAS